MVVTGPPPGMVSVGGYRFVVRDLQDIVGRRRERRRTAGRAARRARRPSAGRHRGRSRRRARGARAGSAPIRCSSAPSASAARSPLTRHSVDAAVNSDRLGLRGLSRCNRLRRHGAARSDGRGRRELGGRFGRRARQGRRLPDRRDRAGPTRPRPSPKSSRSRSRSPIRSRRPAPAPARALTQCVETRGGPVMPVIARLDAQDASPQFPARLPIAPTMPPTG